MTPESASAPRRKLIVATICLFAAAAAFLVWKNLDRDGNIADPLPIEVTDRLPAPTESDDAIESSGTRGTNAAEEAIPDENVRGPSGVTVAVTHMIHSKATAQARQLDDSFYEAFIAELKSIPELILTEHAATDVAALETIITPVTSIDNLISPSDLAQSQGLPFEAAERLANQTADRTVNQVPAIEAQTSASVSNYAYRFSAARLEPSGLGTEPYDFRLAVGTTPQNAALTSMSANAVYFMNGGSGSTSAQKIVPQGSILVRDDMHELAAEIALSLRQRLLPSDSSVLVERESRWLDSSLPVSERLSALASAARDIAEGDSSDLKSSFVSGALAILAESMGIDETSQQNRVLALRLLSSVSDERVVVPLSDMLLYESSETIRLAAVRVLGDYRDNATALTALEAAGQSDASAEVRRYAKWLALDDASRVDTIASIIQDTELTDSQRLAPIYSAISSQLESVSNIDSEFSFDPSTVQVIDDLVRRHEPIVARFYILSYLARSHPESFVPLMIDRLRNDAGPRIRINVIEGLGTQLEVPGVRAALEQAAQADSEEMVRVAAANALQGGQTNPAIISQERGL